MSDTELIEAVSNFLNISFDRASASFNKVQKDITLGLKVLEVAHPEHYSKLIGSKEELS